MINKQLMITVFALVACLLTSGAYYNHAKTIAETSLKVQDSDGIVIVKLAPVSQSQLLNLDSGSTGFIPEISSSKKRLLVFLAGSDCGACLTVVDQINTMAPRRASTLEVDTIFVRSTRAEANQFLTTVKPHFFKAFLDTSGHLDSDLNLPQKTPLIVLVDDKYRVKAAIGATTRYDAQADFVNLVSQMTDSATR